MPTEYNTYDVTVIRTTSVVETTIVTVDAPSESMAIRVVKEKIENAVKGRRIKKAFRWDVDTDEEEFDYDAVEV